MSKRWIRLEQMSKSDQKRDSSITYDVLRKVAYDKGNQDILINIEVLLTLINKIDSLEEQVKKLKYE